MSAGVFYDVRPRKLAEDGQPVDVAYQRLEEALHADSGDFETVTRRNGSRFIRHRRTRIESMIELRRGDHNSLVESILSMRYPDRFRMEIREPLAIDHHNAPSEDGRYSHAVRSMVQRATMAAHIAVFGASNDAMVAPHKDGIARHQAFCEALIEVASRRKGMFPLAEGLDVVATGGLPWGHVVVETGLVNASSGIPKGVPLLPIEIGMAVAGAMPRVVEVDFVSTNGADETLPHLRATTRPRAVRGLVPSPQVDPAALARAVRTLGDVADLVLGTP